MQQIIDLDGNTQNWSLTGTIAHGRVHNKSDLHLKARSLLKECFPTVQLLEEVPIPLKKSEVLYLDFYLPLLKKCVEVHGSQHYKFTPFYHVNMMGFAKHKKRDKEKQEWCQINGIDYLELPFDKTIDEWRSILTHEHQNQ